jgi:Ni/Co efflux regulator RcnB
MKTTLTTAALATLLFASASGVAFAQDREQHGQGQQQPHAQGQQPHAQAPHGGPPGGGEHRGGPPGGGGMPHGPGPGGAPGGHAEHAPAPGVRGPAGGGGEPRASHEEAPQAARGPGSNGGAQRSFERQGGHPGGGHDVTMPAGSRGAAAGRAPGTGQFGGSRTAPQHWQAGRSPTVFQSHARFHAGAYRPPSGYYARSWGFGQILPRAWFARNYWMTDFLDFGLPYPPPGYTWVRVGPDALMIDQYSGRIVQVVRGIFW